MSEKRGTQQALGTGEAARATKLFCIKFFVIGALNFPLLWLCLGGLFRTYVCLLFGFLALSLLWVRGWHRELKSYLQYFLLGGLFVVLAFLMPSETEGISSPQFLDLFFYTIPTGILLARFASEKSGITCLNWVYTLIILILAGWGLLFIGQIDLAHAAVLTNSGVTRYGTNETVELFRIFSYENTMIQVIPFALYPMSAGAAVFCKGPILLRGAVAASMVCGMYVSGSVYTRTPFLAGGIATAILAVYLLFHSKRTARLKVLASLTLMGVCLALACVTVPEVGELTSGLIDRFSDTTSDQRQYLWEESVRLIVQNPFGGGDRLLSEHYWAHDVILDMGLLYGFPGLLAMIAILVRLSRSTVNWLRSFSQDIEMVHIIMIGIFFGALIAALISPPDLAFMTPILFIGTYATERLRMKRRHEAESQRSKIAVLQPANACV